VQGLDADCRTPGDTDATEGPSQLVARSLQDQADRQWADYADPLDGSRRIPGKMRLPRRQGAGLLVDQMRQEEGGQLVEVALERRLGLARRSVAAERVAASASPVTRRRPQLRALRLELHDHLRLEGPQMREHGACFVVVMLLRQDQSTLGPIQVGRVRVVVDPGRSQVACESDDDGPCPKISDGTRWASSMPVGPAVTGRGGRCYP